LVDADRFDLLNACRWHLSSGYVVHGQREAAGKKVFQMHRLVLGLRPDDPRQGDHINRDRRDNRRANLRVATAAENAQNVPARPNTSPYRGVHWDSTRGKWMARVKIDRKHVCLGRYDDELEAARVAAEYRAEHMPFSLEAAAA
jgi:hypothetical protein